MPVLLTRAKLSVERVYRALEDPRAGGVVVFVGRVRPDRVRAGRVAALDYEADRPLADRSLEELVRRTRRRFGVRRVVVYHRLGRLGVGVPSVIVGVAASHRASAFAACRFLIAELKRKVPIWKTERARPARPPRRRPSPPAARAAG